MKKYVLTTTPLDKLHQDFIPAYETFIEYAHVTGFFVGVAGVLLAVIKSIRN